MVGVRDSYLARLVGPIGLTRGWDRKILSKHAIRYS
jgi:hypothetical protein